MLYMQFLFVNYASSKLDKKKMNKQAKDWEKKRLQFRIHKRSYKSTKQLHK